MVFGGHDLQDEDHCCRVGTKINIEKLSNWSKESLRAKCISSLISFCVLKGTKWYTLFTMRELNRAIAESRSVHRGSQNSLELIKGWGVDHS